jgi:NAD(P)-dependent dehydrogenase (short-subunit alcohol dehydrogenase family)
VFEPGLLRDKVVLVTGGGTGLGRSMATRFLELGARLAIAGRRAEVLERVAGELSASGGEVLPVPADVRDPGAVSTMLDAVEARFGRLDVLVNNAAGNFVSPTERLSHRAVDAVLGIVLHGTFYCTPRVRQALDRGRESGRRPQRRHDLRDDRLGLRRALGRRQGGRRRPHPLARRRVGQARHPPERRRPRPFPTEGAWSRLMPTPEIERLFAGRVPLGRTGDHLELANLAAFLVSDGAGYITGDVVTIDGGESAWNAGEFNVLDAVTEEQWDALEAARRRG